MNTQSQIALTPETLPAIAWENHPVITTGLLASVYGVQDKQIRQNFVNNQTRFTEGVHYYKLIGDDLKGFKNQVEIFDLVEIAKNTAHLMLWTERGTVRHAKMLGTDQAWDVQDRLEEFYFSRQAIEQAPEPKTKKALPNGLTLEQQDTIKALVNARAEGLPKSQQTRAIIQGWSAIKKKFELSKKQTYKDISPDNFVNIISLLSRLPIEGELVEKDVDEFLSSHQYRNEARRSINAHLDACHEEMAQAGVKAPEWPAMDEKTITGLAASMLWQSRWLMSFNPDTMKPELHAIPMNAQALSFEQWIDHAKNRGYVVIKRDELLHKLEASH